MKRNKKPSKKTFRAQVIVKNCHKDFGLGKGVIMEQEISFNDEMKRGFKSPLFSMALIEHEDRLLREICEIKWKEVK